MAEKDWNDWMAFDNTEIRVILRALKAFKDSPSCRAFEKRAAARIIDSIKMDAPT